LEHLCQNGVDMAICHPRTHFFCRREDTRRNSTETRLTFFIENHRLVIYIDYLSATFCGNIGHFLRWHRDSNDTFPRTSPRRSQFELWRRVEVESNRDRSWRPPAGLLSPCPRARFDLVPRAPHSPFPSIDARCRRGEDR
jgi:hypothetical protein